MKKIGDNLNYIFVNRQPTDLGPNPPTQFLSSELSEQSATLSHCLRMSMHSPLSHVNSCDVHRRPSEGHHHVNDTQNKVMIKRPILVIETETTFFQRAEYRWRCERGFRVKNMKPFK